MARAVKFPPSILSHVRGYDFIRVRQDGRPRDVRLGPTGSPESRARYAELVAQMTAHGGQLPGGNSGIRESANSCTIPAVCYRWLEHVQTAYDHARSPEPGNYRWIVRVLLRLFSDLPAAEFTADHLEQFRTATLTGSWMTSEERNRFLGRWKKPRPLGLCRGQANRRVIGLRTMWRWCERKRLVPAGSWAALRALPPLRSGAQGARASKPRVVATAETVERVAVELAKRTAPVDVMLRVQFLTGARSAEVRTMRPADIDRSGDVWLYRPARHKNDWRLDASGQPQERVIPLGPECQRLLTPLLERTQPEEYLFRPRYGSRAGCYSKGAYCLAIRRAAERAGLEGFTGYSCRHGAKTRIARAHGLEAARVVLGHRSLEMTAAYGDAIDQDLAAKVAREMG